MTQPTCKSCDCVAGCQSRERLCPNLAEPLPPLPRASYYERGHAYSADQMQAYARAAIVQPEQPARFTEDEREAIKAFVYKQVAEDYRKKDTEMFSGADIAEWCECEALLIDDTIAQPEQPAPKSLNGWREINTLDLSDELVWLRDGGSIDGPLVADTDCYDSYTHWATVTPPPINIAQPEKTIHKNVQLVAYALQWPSDSRINLSTVFDTRAEAVYYKDSCGTKEITVVPLYAAAQHRVLLSAIAQPEQQTDIQKQLADLHQYEEIAEFYAQCAISPEALRDWVAERMDMPAIAQPKDKLVPVQGEPAAWAVWWGIGAMRKNSVHFERKTAEEAAAQIKSCTELRPLYAAIAQPEQQTDIKALVHKVHAAKGRHHSQIAMCNLYDACNLPNVRPGADSAQIKAKP